MTDWIDATHFLRFYRFGSSNQYSAYHTGVDANLNLPTWDSDAGAPVWACADGVVTFARRVPSPSTWGRLVVIRHQHGDRTVHSRYAHMATMLVSEGDAVSRGQQIGTIGGAEFNLANHLHFDISHSGILETNPTHWPGSNKQGVVDHYVDPKTFLALNSGIAAPPATRVTVTDVSAHQGAIDFERMMNRGTVACYVRGSIGGSGTDIRFATNWSAVAQTPMKRGIYHLFRSDSTADENLANIVRLVNQRGAGDMRIAIDVEPVTGLATIDGDRVARLISLFTDAFGYSPLIYSGDWVYPHVSGDRSWFGTSLLWLAEYWSAPPPVGLYPDLPPGATMGNLLMHQWTSSYHTEADWGVSSSGLDINNCYELSRLLVDAETPPPPPAPTVDMAQYFLPRAGDFGDIVLLRNSWTGGQERQQLQREGNISYLTKGTEYERRVINSDEITLELDTSPGEDEYYRVESSTGWMPRHWRPGETFTRTETAEFFRKADCAATGQILSGVSDLRFAALHSRYTTRGGITFENVAEVHWIRNGAIEEWYFYAAHYGLIAWRNRGGRESWAVEVIPVGQQIDNARERGCFS